LIDNYRIDLKSTIFIAPHHGGSTLSTAILIELIKPQYVIFPVRYKNRFRFPHKKVVARYMKNNAVLLNIAQSGAITFKFNNKSAILSIDLYREKERRFWHDN
jgi:competence protein ComEC